MPSDMRLQCPSEDTPPSTRPPSVASSAASTSGTPHRSTSMDSLHTNSSSDKPVGEEYIPTRLIRASPKANVNALQFIKTGPAQLHKSAKEQMKKAEVVKSLRKTSLQEEEEWQSTQISPAPSNVPDEGSDWQMNLDKWKSNRRKRNEDVLERVIEVKKFEQQDELEGSRGRRKSKTFNEMREDKNRRGRRYNLVVHDDDNNDLSELGLNVNKNGSSLSDAPDEPEFARNADTKSDAGFCTGSDTGSDGVFAEDSISDTSSALGDKREIHDSLESGVSSMPKDSGEVFTNGHHVAVPMTITKKSNSNLEGEYTYAKAIEDYKQFAENSVKKRTSSASSTASGGPKDDERPGSAAAGKKIEERLSFFDGLEKAPPPAAEPRFLRRERAHAKVDLDKRRSMFELRDFDCPRRQDEIKRQSVNVNTSSLRHKVASFENVNEAATRVRGVGAAPPRDVRFKEKLASFSLKEKGVGNTTPRKKAPERDQNFYQKLQSFSRMESAEERSPTEKKGVPEWRTASMSRTSPDRKDLLWSGAMAPAPAPLKDRIASFENLSPAGETSPGRRELSVSMENLHHHRGSASTSEVTRTLYGSQSISNLFPFRRAPSTPFMVVELDEEERMEEQPCVRTDATAAAAAASYRDYEIKSATENGETKELKPLSTPRESAIEPSAEVQPPRVLESLPPRVPDLPPPTLMETLSPPISFLVTPGRTDPESQEVSCIGRTPRKLPELPNTPLAQDLAPQPYHPIEVPDIPPPQVPDEIPPPVPPPRVPTIEDPHRARVGMCVESSSLGSSHPEGEADEGEGKRPEEATRKGEIGTTALEYGDGDIDEVIDNYEHLSEAITIGDGQAYHEPHPLSAPLEPSLEENVYERIAEDEPVYENIYEKVPDDLETQSGAEESLEHHYQTLEEVSTQKANLSPPSPVSPTLPPKSKTLSVFEVLDVTWTEDGSSAPAAPPSEPPPPPPPEEDGREEEELEDLAQSGVSSPASTIPSAPPVENEGRCDKAAMNSPPLVKHSLRQQMSDFLGTKPYVEEVNLQPPPDVNELLRKEREAERLIVQRQASLSRDSPLSDSDFSSGSLAPLGRPRYTWEDRMKADGPKSKVDLDESSDHLEFQAPVENQSSSVHAIKKYLSHFSAKPFLVHNIHNNSLQEIFGTTNLLPQTRSSKYLNFSSKKFPSCENLSTNSNRTSVTIETKPTTFGGDSPSNVFINSQGLYLRKARSVSSLHFSEETDIHPPRKKQTAASFIASSFGGEPSDETLMFGSPLRGMRKAESATNLPTHRDTCLSCANWCRSLESINVDSNGSIRETKRSYLYILPQMNTKERQNISNDNPSVPRSASDLPSRISKPDLARSPYTPLPRWARPLPVSSTPPSSPTTSLPLPSQHDQPFSQLHTPSTSPTTREAKRSPRPQRSSPISTSTTAHSFLHEDLHTLVESTYNRSHAYLFGALSPFSKGSTSRSLQELASILALEENIVELKKKKLAELEQEMEKHDRHMLQRIKGPVTNIHDPLPAPRDGVSPPPQYSGKQALGETPKPAFPDLDTTLAAATVITSKPQPTQLLLANSTPSAPITAGLPIQEFYTAPSFTKYEEMDATVVTADSASAPTGVGFGSRSKMVQENTFTEASAVPRGVEAKKVERTDIAASKATQQVPPPLPRKSILALSAIPKPRLTDNDSWIMKKKNDSGKKDYNKHWLIQEAEQRRLEQQDRISRPSQLSINKTTSSSFQSAPGYQNHFQNIKSSFHNTSPTTYNSTPFSSSSNSNGSSLSNSRPNTTYHNGPNPSVHPTNDSSSKPISNTHSSTLPPNNSSSPHNNNNWKKQTKTYQPPQPSPPTGSNKPLPDAIINTLTQRVNNKNKMNGSTRPTVYSSTSSSSTYRPDDSYHDYMNTDSFSAVHNNNLPAGPTPVISQGSQQQGLGTGPPLPPVGNQSPAHANEDQRLLSVSGKKKCSHCGEELGRGAAMIIESLRLFYHIPCFKCCVCGTQLGNGTSGADVRVRNHKLHCHNCYSNDEGMKFSKV